MKNYKSFIALFLILISAGLIYLLRQVPSAQFWTGYSVLYVPVDTPDEIVLKGFEENAIENFVCLSKQFVPMKMVQNSPEYSMFMMNRHLPEFSYLYDRNNYFFDKDHTYRIYYIPSEYKQKFSALLKYLQHWNVSANIDSKASYPWIITLVCTVLGIILSFFSRKKSVYFSGIIFPLFYIACNPFYPTAFSACLFMLVIMFVSNLWNRKNAVECLMKNYFIGIVLVVSLVSGFAVSLKIGILTLVMYAAVISVLYFFVQIEAYFESRLLFSPVYIRPAKIIPVFSGKTFTVLSTVLVCMLILLISFVFSNNFKETNLNSDIDHEKIYFPIVTAVPSFTGTENKLPTLEDYYRWNWNVTTYPYKSINTSTDSDTFIFPRYVQKENGIVMTEDVYIFDDEYKNAVYNQIDDLGFNSIEQLLKTQNNSIFPSYSSSGAVKTGLMYTVMCFICVFILLFLYISIMIKKGVRK